jgi:maltose/moltooligosaccharide transporter
MRGDDSTLLVDDVTEALPEAGATAGATEAHHIPALSLRQSLLFGSGGIAGGLVFTMMNNALPLFLFTYTMPLGLPAFLNPGGAIPATLVALLANERSLFGGLIQPLVGHLSDRTRSPIGKRSPYLVVGGLGTAAAIGALALHPSFWLMILAVTMAGVALYVAVGPYTTLLADITPFGQRGRVGGLIALFGVVGAISFTVLSILLWGTAREWVFLITAALVAVSMLVVAAGVREPHNAMHHTRAELHRVPVLRGLLADRTLATYVGAMAIYWLGAGAAAPFITRFGVVELGLQEHDAFILLLMVVLATSIGAIVVGLMGDRFGRKRVLQPALVLFALAALVGSQVHDVVQALPVMIFVGLGNAAPTALHLPLLADLVPRARAGAYMGYASLVWSVAQPLGSLLAGVLVDATGSYRGVFIFAAACMLAASFLMRKVPSRRS